MQDHEHHRRTVEEYRDRILRGDLPPVANEDLAEALEILERHGRPTGVNVRLADGRTQAGDLVLATATLPPILRARSCARWHDRTARSARRQARRGSSRQARLRVFAVAHARAAQPCGARLRVARPRGAGRPARRAGSSSSTSSADPGDPDPEPPPSLQLAGARS